MSKQNIIDRIKEIIASMAWKVFLWANGFSQEQYWKMIYEQEKNEELKYEVGSVQDFDDKTYISHI